MFCGNCGAENLDEAKFCKSCGQPLYDSSNNNVVNNDPNVTVNSNMGNTVVVVNNGVNLLDKIKAIPKKVLGIAGAAIIALIVIISIAANVAKTINLDKYMTIEATGYDTRGKATAKIDWDAIEEKYGSKISYTSQAKSEFGGLTGMVKPIESLREYVSVDLSSESELTNGDTIEYTWDIDEDLKKYLKAKIKYKNGSYNVTDLEEIEMFDPFEGVELSYSGIAPNGECAIAENPNEHGLNYSFDRNYGLSNGDTVTLSVSYGWDTEDAYVEKNGQLPSAMTKEFTVEGLDEYINSYADIDETLMTDMKKQAEDSIVAYVAKNYAQTSSLGPLEYAGYIYRGTKPGVSYWSEHNMMYIIFKGKASSSEDNFKPTDVYFPVKFSELMKNSEGESYGSCDGLVGSSTFDNSTYTTDGYINPLLAYISLAENDTDSYCVESGDGFEGYSEYSLVTDLNEVDEKCIKELQAVATEIVNNYISEYYTEDSIVSNLELKGEYFILAKDTEAEYLANKNKIYIVLGGQLHKGDNAYDDCDIYYPVCFNGVVNVSDNIMYCSHSDILGYTTLLSSYYGTAGYADAELMYNDIISLQRDKYTYQVSEGLKEFGE